jgi:hypothetical protein
VYAKVLEASVHCCTEKLYTSIFRCVKSVWIGFDFLFVSVKQLFHFSNNKSRPPRFIRDSSLMNLGGRVTNKTVTISLTVYNLFTNVMSKSTFAKHKILENLIA